MTNPRNSILQYVAPDYPLFICWKGRKHKWSNYGFVLIIFTAGLQFTQPASKPLSVSQILWRFTDCPCGTLVGNGGDESQHEPFGDIIVQCFTELI